MDVLKAVLVVVLIVGVAALVGMTIVCSATQGLVPSPFCNSLLDTLLELAGTIRHWLGR